MLRRTLSRLALLIPVLLLAVPAAHAQDDGSPHHVGGFVGFQIFDLGDGFADAGAEIDEQVVFGGRYEYRIRPNLGIGGEVSFSPAEATLAAAGADADIDVWYVNGTVTYHFLEIETGPIHPFATGGAGFVAVAPEETETEYFPSLNFGGGVMGALNERISLRGDVRGLLYFADDLDPTNAAILGGDFDETIFDLQITGGVNFNF